MKKYDFTLTCINFCWCGHCCCSHFCSFELSHIPCSFPILCKKNGGLAARASSITLRNWLFITINCPNLPDKHLISDMGCVNSCCCLTFQNNCYLSFIVLTSLSSQLTLPFPTPPPTQHKTDGREMLWNLIELHFSGL